MSNNYLRVAPPILKYQKFKTLLMSLLHHTHIQITLLRSALCFFHGYSLVVSPTVFRTETGVSVLCFHHSNCWAKKKKNLALKTTIVGKLNLGLFLDVFSGSPQLLCLNLRTDSMGRSLKKGVKSREDEKQEAPFPGCSPEKMSVFSRGWALGGSIRQQMA